MRPFSSAESRRGALSLERAFLIQRPLACRRLYRSALQERHFPGSRMSGASPICKLKSRTGRPVHPAVEQLACCSGGPRDIGSTALCLHRLPAVSGSLNLPIGRSSPSFEWMETSLLGSRDTRWYVTKNEATTILFGTINSTGAGG